LVISIYSGGTTFCGILQGYRMPFRTDCPNLNSITHKLLIQNSNFVHQSTPKNILLWYIPLKMYIVTKNNFKKTLKTIRIKNSEKVKDIFHFNENF